MAGSFDVAVLVGSLRKGSYTRKIVHNLMQLAPDRLKLDIIEIAQLPHYNADLETDPPKEWAWFRKRINAADAVLFATPEYNRSIPGALKNAIDVGSRPRAQSAWEGKPAAVISVSTGAIGAFGANHHLRQAMVFLNMPCLLQPEAYIGGVVDLLDEQGNVKNPKTREFLTKFVNAFAEWAEKIRGPAAAT